MERICPNCGKELPEEAEFCLYCFTDIKNFKKDKEAPAKPVVEKTTVAQPEVKEQKKSEKKSKKKMLCRIACVLAFLVVILLCAVGMKSCGRKDAPVNNEDFVTQTTVVKETVAVAVTDPQGEQVTDAQGEQVTSIVEVTKVETITIATTTQKQGFFDKLFSTTAPSKNDKNTTENNTSAGGETSGNGTTETTEKGFIDGIIDSIFGDDEEESTTQETQPSTTEAHDTTAPTTVPGTTKPHTTSPVTTTTPSTTQKVTEATTQKPVTTTQKPVTTTQVQTTAGTATPVSDFEYKISGKYVTITKYIGNATHVVIPAVVESKYVTDISKHAFKDNDTVEVVTFADDSKRPHLWVTSYTFRNCQNLRIINMPDEDLGIMNNFASGCPNIEKVTLKNNQYRYENGCLYYSGGKGWVVRWVAPAAEIGTLTLPLWSTGIEGAANLEENTNIKNIILHKDTKYFPDQSNLPPSLENIYVEDGCAKGYDINGIAFAVYDDHTSCIYPSQNKSTELTLPENTYLYTQYVRNPYLKSLRIPKTAVLMVTFYTVNGVSFSNLETVYIEDGHPNKDSLVADARVDNIYIY